MAPTSILFYKEVGHSQEGAQEVVSLFGDKGVFDGPKPVRLLQRLITLANLKEDSIVLDFFSGSASTAHALMKTNSEKDKHCQFILVQLPEEVSDSKKDQGYKNICEIGKERIRRAGAKIKADFPLTTQNLDTGFRVYRLDESNYEKVSISPKEYKQDQLDLFANNIKADRTDLDLRMARPEGLPANLGLQEQGYYLSEIQADAILRMSLRNLTGLDQEEIVGDYKNIMAKIIDFLDILAKPERITQIIREELGETLIGCIDVATGRQFSEAELDKIGKQYGIRILANFISRFGKRIAHLVYRICTTDRIFITYLVSELLTNGIHHINALY